MKTIPHEKIHIFQRYNPILTLKLYIDYWKLSIYDYSSDERQRSNPDINKYRFTYFNPESNGMIYNLQVYEVGAKKISDSRLIAEYANQNVTNFSTIYYDLLRKNPSYQKEHPNEVMACLLADMILFNKLHIPTKSFLFKHF